jgi:hypothetical protein
MMKKLYFLLLLLMFVSLYAVDVHNNSPFHIISQNAKYMDIEFTLPSYKLVNETGLGQSFQRIQITQADYLAMEGMPELPVFSGMIAIPYHGIAEMQILSQQDNTITGITPFPVQTKDNDQSGAVEFQMNRNYYQNGSKYPSQIATTDNPSILRDFRVMNFSVHPFVYDASSKQMLVHNKVTVRIEFKDAPGVNEMEAPTSYSTSFQPMYNSLLLNYNDVRDLGLPYQPERILIIYANSTDNTFLSKLTEFVNWKQQKGYVVQLASTTQAGTSNSAIKTFIQNAYNNTSTRPDYVILIGDAAGTFTIPAWNFTWNLRYTGEGDYPYTHLAGSDLLGDVYIGRMSISSTNDFLNLVAKGFAYERDMNLTTQQPWLNKMLLVGDSGSSGISTIYVSKYIKEISYAYNSNYTYSEVYSGFSSGMNTALNSGVAYMNYRGYLGMSGWSPGTSLVNGSKTPHAVIITCGTGTFANGTSTTETFTRLGTATSPAGALTAIGMATTGTHTMLNNCLAGSIFEGLFTYDMHNMGQAMLYGKIYLDKVYHAEDAELTEAFAHICNLIGDPTVEAFKSIPNTLRISAPFSVAVGVNLIDISVTGNGNTPIENAKVAATQGANVLFNGITDVNGHVTLNMPINWAGSFTVTASKQDYLPFVETISSDATGSLLFQNTSIDDITDGTSIGNGDGILDAGETVELTCNIKNTTSTTQSNLYGVLTSDDSNITIISDSTLYGVIQSGNIGSNSTPFLFAVQSSCPDTYRARFNLIIHDNLNNIYTVPFILTIRNADMDVTAVQLIDGSNQILDPGDNATINLTLTNNGAIPANELYASLRSLSSLVVVTDTLAYFGNANLGSSVNCNSNTFGIMGRLQLVPGMIIPFELRLYNSNGFEEIESFQLTVGTVTSHDPMGPDTYGYYIYDTTDTSYPDVPSYNWIGIAPVEGGTGSTLTLNDVGSQNDEGDTTGAVSIASVTLPFSFSFYGEQYSQMSVCSNGFIAFGSTQNGDFRNWHLPGALGPNPMIAVFWDDLCLLSASGGAVYTYYNAAEHYYVVEWYHTTNGYNRTSEETFEAILYDQQFYPTSLGDGQIKLQYKTFNNVDAGSFDGYTPSHGNYCTVGIKDHTGTRGLEYTFNNQYPTAAAPLGNSKALLITGTPIFHQDPHLLLSETVLHNTNSSQSLEPGETGDLSIRINNMGEATATNVNATISTADPYVTILTPSSLYDPIPGEQTGLNKTYFRLQVSPSCPDAHVISLTVDINAEGFSWQRQTTLTVVKPQLVVENTFINDHAGNGNGVADPGEAIKLGVNIKNPGNVITHDAELHLSTTNPNVTISESQIGYGDIPINGIVQKDFIVQISSAITPNTYINFEYTITAQDMETVTGQISMGIGLSGISEGFEQNNGGFTGGGWAWGTSVQAGSGHSGQKMWGTSLNASYANNQHYQLLSPNIPIGSNATLTFWHMYGFELNYDGGNVWVSTNQGATYTILTPDGGYTSQSLPALQNLPGYNGTLLNWTQAVFSLAAYAGQTIQIDWNFQSDNSITNIGWFIDDVEISGFLQSTGSLTGNVILPPNVLSPELATITAGNYTTHPDSLGHYEMLLPNGNYNVSATMPSCQSTQATNVVFADDVISHNIDFTFNYLRPIAEVFYTVNSQIAHFAWIAPLAGSNHFSHFNVYRQIETDIFRKIAEISDTTYIDTLHVIGNYAYYFTAVYNEGESNSSNICMFNSTSTGNVEPLIVPVATKLNRNYPNPFNPDTHISFALAENGVVNLTIYNIKGQKVKTLVDDHLVPGNYNLIWNGKNEDNKPVASGVYFFRLQTPKFVGINKAILLK